MTWPPKPGHAGVGNIGHKVGSSNMTLPMKYDQRQEALTMGKVTVELDQQTHLKLKLICTTKDIKIKDYVEELLAKHIAEDYQHLDIPTR